MARKGIRKAAVLLMSLDPSTAAELLRTASPEIIKQIATELAYLQASGHEKGSAPADPIKEFFDLLGRDKSKAGRGDFVRKLLTSTIGEEQSREIMHQVEDLVEARDPFLPIRSAGVADIAQALKGESPQAVAVVLPELPPERSGELLSLLPEDVRTEAVRGMTSTESPSPGAILRVAGVIRERLGALRQEEAPRVPDEGQREQKLRKVAVLLRGMEPALRDPLLKAIAERDQETGGAVQKLMILWEDIPVVGDEALQQVLRELDGRKLALAVFDGDKPTDARIRKNMSQRANALLDEELTLLRAPKPDDVALAREEMLQLLHDLNAKGELTFEKG